MSSAQEKNVPHPTDIVRRWRLLGLNANKVARALGMQWRTVRNVERPAWPTSKGTLRQIDAWLREQEQR
jgi:hypothetical protein